MRPSQLLRAKKPDPSRLAALLESYGFQDPSAAARHLADLLGNRAVARWFGGVSDRFFTLVSESADPDRALLNFARFAAVATPADGEQQPAWVGALDLLVKTFSVSLALADALIRSPDLLPWLVASLDTPKQKRTLARELRAMMQSPAAAGVPAADERGAAPMVGRAEALAVVRRFKRRQMLRIGVRDLLNRASLEETTRELSDLADVCVEQVCRLAWDELVARHGVPLCEDGPGRTRPAEFAVIGMGKLGGQELNYSSDIDVMFLYSAEGETVAGNPDERGRAARRAKPIRPLSNHEFFTRLAEAIIAGVGEVTADGNVFRIDLRLRPEGSSGPLVRSLESYENYYAQWGQTWERMALIKARCIAGSQPLAHEFFEIIQPFRFPRHLSSRILREIAQIKERIENEIVREDRLRRHVKLGIGGIREIEFIAQTLQLLHAGRQPFVQTPNTLQALQKLGQYELLPLKDCDALREAYRFLRIVEHRLQMEAELQTHTLPDEPRAQLRIARAVGFRTVEGFHAALETHTRRVRDIYEELLLSEFGGEEARREELFRDRAQRQQFRAELAGIGFQDPEGALASLERLAHGPGYVQVSRRTTEMFLHNMPRLLEICRLLAAPDAALHQLERFVEGYGARAVLFEMFSNTPKLLELFLKLFDRSRFLTEVVLRRPELIEEVTREHILHRARQPDQLRKDLRHPSVPHDPRNWLRLFKRAELLRIGLRDILGLEPAAEIHAEITSLADVCVEFALEHSRAETRLRTLPFCVFGLGKLGGQELGYGADLDVLFLTDNAAASRAKAVTLATALIDFLTRPTAEGMVFAVDTRLRPDGQQGPLVTSLATCEDYYARRAQLWERQALTRARFIAGTAALRDKFETLVREQAFGRGLTDTDLQEVLRMRRRIERERGNPARPELEFKTGPGGLLDVEFLVQALQMRHGARHPALRTPNTRQALQALTEAKLLAETEAALLRDGYEFLRRVEAELRRVDNKAVSALPGEPAEQAALAKRLGFAGRDEFWSRLQTHRGAIRAVFERTLGPLGESRSASPTGAGRAG